MDTTIVLRFRFLTAAITILTGVMLDGLGRKLSTTLQCVKFGQPTPVSAFARCPRSHWNSPKPVLSTGTSSSFTLMGRLTGCRFCRLSHVLWLTVFKGGQGLGAGARPRDQKFQRKVPEGHNRSCFFSLSIIPSLSESVTFIVVCYKLVQNAGKRMPKFRYLH